MREEREVKLVGRMLPSSGKAHQSNAVYSVGGGLYHADYMRRRSQNAAPDNRIG